MTTTSFLARFTGRCPSCDEAIHISETIRYDADDNIIHDECGDPKPRKPVPVCTECWLEKPCACD